MIHGLKFAFTGEEIVRAIDERLDEHHASIQFKRDEIAGKFEHKEGFLSQVPVEAVETEILEVEHRIRTLTMYRDRILPKETYLLGKRDLKLANLMPRRPAPPEFDPEKEIQWVTRAD
jgi:hypothetical protein